MSWRLVWATTDRPRNNEFFQSYFSTCPARHFYPCDPVIKMSLSLYNLKYDLNSELMNENTILYDRENINKLVIAENDDLNHFSCRSVGIDAPYSHGGIHKFRVTHPFHPLYGQEFEIIENKRIQARDRVFFRQKDGSKGSLPLVWCDLRPPDPYLDIEGKHSPFRVEDLLKLSDMIEEVRR